MRGFTASLLAIDEGRIKVIRAEIGGGFGGKTIGLSRTGGRFARQKSGRPVKMVMTRAEGYNKKGTLLNTGPLDYRMPMCLDLPQIETILVELPNPNHPLGTRGAGEIAIVPGWRS